MVKIFTIANWILYPIQPPKSPSDEYQRSSVQAFKWSQPCRCEPSPMSTISSAPPPLQADAPSRQPFSSALSARHPFPAVSQILLSCHQDKSPGPSSKACLHSRPSAQSSQNSPELLRAGCSNGKDPCHPCPGKMNNVHSIKFRSEESRVTKKSVDYNSHCMLR